MFIGRGIVLNLIRVRLDLGDGAGGSLAAAADDDVCLAEVKCFAVQRWALHDKIKQRSVEVESAVGVFLGSRRRVRWWLCEDSVEPLLNRLGSRDALVTGH